METHTFTYFKVSASTLPTVKIYFQCGYNNCAFKSFIHIEMGSLFLELHSL